MTCIINYYDMTLSLVLGKLSALVAVGIHEHLQFLHAFVTPRLVGIFSSRHEILHHIHVLDTVALSALESGTRVA